MCLSSQAQLDDETSISLYVLATKVVEKPPTLTDHQKQATPTVVVVFVLSKVFCQVVDPLGEQGHLNLRRAGVAVVCA
jgi:hypothetical protein